MYLRLVGIIYTLSIAHLASPRLRVDMAEVFRWVFCSAHWARWQFGSLPQQTREIADQCSVPVKCKAGKWGLETRREHSVFHCHWFRVERKSSKQYRWGRLPAPQGRISKVRVAFWNVLM